MCKNLLVAANPLFPSKLIDVAGSVRKSRMVRKPLPWRNRFAFMVIFKMALGLSLWRTCKAAAEILRGKRVRGWNKLNRLAQGHPEYYKNWISSVEKSWFDGFIGQNVTKDVFSPICLVLESDRNPHGVAGSIASLQAAFGQDVRVLVTGDQDDAYDGALGVGRASLRQVISGEMPADEDYILPIRAGDTISPLAGRVLARACRQSGTPPIIFWDTDILVEGVRSRPWFKPDWDHWLYLSGDTLSGASMVKWSALAGLGDVLLDAALSPAVVAELLVVLASDKNAAAPLHVAGVLGHWAREERYVTAPHWKDIIARSWSEPVEAVSDAHGAFFVHQMPKAPPVWPTVSIIIPTRDRIKLLKTCMRGLDLLVYHGRVEVLIVDNGSSDPYALAFLAELDGSGRATVLRDSEAFNFSRLNNFAAMHAKGDILCLLNNDIEMQDGDWLSTLVRFVLSPGVGAAGPMLTYPDGSIQHAGVVIGMGDAAGHMCRFSIPGKGGDLGWHGTVRSVSAVTAACLVVRRDAWEAVGGLDEKNFAVAFNDVDFCLKLQRAGYRNVYVPAVSLIHHESLSRGSDMAPANRERFAKELALFRARWGSEGFADPHFSPLYDSSFEQCLLKF